MRYFRFFAVIVFVASLMCSCGGKDYAIKVKANAKSVAAGEKSAVTLRLKARGKWHIADDSIIFIKVNPPAGFKFEKEELTEKDKQGGKNIFAANYTVEPAAAKGPNKIGFEIMFSVCNDELCQRIMETREVEVTVK